MTQNHLALSFPSSYAPGPPFASTASHIHPCVDTPMWLVSRVSLPLPGPVSPSHATSQTPRLVSSRLVPSQIPCALSRTARIILVRSHRSRRLSHPNPRSLSSRCAHLIPRRMLSSSRALSFNVFQLALTCPRPRLRCPARHALPVTCYIASLRRPPRYSASPFASSSHSEASSSSARSLDFQPTYSRRPFSQWPRLCLLGSLYRSRLPLSAFVLSRLMPRSPGPQIRNGLFRFRLDLYRVSLLCLVL
ncbi:uncharacterized protein C8Q71DRAFT_504604 [Rhodofomes roseus]|uniref:Uncharacterized protein n=1 Tax=Rhodofomes roseus TaxID=34475 RepID=A0ABQ8KLR7_9APHY|nr:uncharacterized protein C8Q71DRAFT_504604 [Rhodofomes roseus]KAH9839269.1 hypothetical protein C8Q71DRAFT_504604 [Rhodofomes roseus]